MSDLCEFLPSTKDAAAGIAVVGVGQLEQRSATAAGEEELVFIVDGVVIDTRPGAAQDERGVDMTLVERTLAMTPDERVRRLDAVLNSVQAMRGALDADR